MHVKFLAAGAGLIGYGALWGWAITADRYDRKVQEEKNELAYLCQYLRHEVVTLRDKLSDLESEATVVNISEGRLHSVSLDEEPNVFGETVTIVDPEISPEGETAETEVTNDDDVASDEPIETTRSNLQSLIDTYTANPDDVDTFVNVAERSIQDEHTPPFIISKGKYAWDEEEGDDYSKITLTYFPRERLLIDDDEEPVEDVANTVGWRNLTRFGEESDDPDVVFIRNRRLETDFEVVREEENPIPLHIKYGMSRTEFETNKAAGVIKFRAEDI